jgi:hypothetical protein
LAGAGCPHDPAVEFYTRKIPVSKDLIGTYRLRSQSLNKVPIAELKSPTEAAPGPCTITLKDDGILEYQNVPIWVGGWANKIDQWSVSEFRSGTGKWRIDTVGSTHDAKGVVQLYGLILTEAKIDDYVMLLGEKPPYEIMFGYDDPDGGYAMIFEIVPAEAHGDD